MYNIIISGVGGQGILSIAFVIDQAALAEGLYFLQSEVHGMSQRGGAVESHLRLSETEIFSPLIPQGEADLILSVEPLEALRYFLFSNRKERSSPAAHHMSIFLTIRLWKRFSEK